LLVFTEKLLVKKGEIQTNPPGNLKCGPAQPSLFISVVFDLVNTFSQITPLACQFFYCQKVKPRRVKQNITIKDLLYFPIKKNITEM
jgi:hypothetical protein